VTRLFPPLLRFSLSLIEERLSAGARSRGKSSGKSAIIKFDKWLVAAHATSPPDEISQLRLVDSAIP